MTPSFRDLAAEQQELRKVVRFALWIIAAELDARWPPDPDPPADGFVSTADALRQLTDSLHNPTDPPLPELKVKP